MTELQLKNRHHLRKKESKRILNSMEEQLGLELKPFRSGSLELAEWEDLQLIIVKNTVLGFFINNQPFLTLHGFLALGEDLNQLKKYITVDKGAVKFVSNGADIMVPGIVETDENIQTGDFVWIREETHKKPLAVGEALMSAGEIRTIKDGKAVKSIHYIGDRIWNLKI